MQAANEKTFGGAPYEFTDNDYVSAFDHSANAVDPARGKGIGGTRVALNKYWLSAARLTSFGSVLQAYSRDYSADRVMKVTVVDALRGERLVEGITDIGHPLYAVRGVNGSKIALFGVQRRGLEGFGLNRRQVFKNEILDAIHAVELGEGLPYSTGDGGVWSRRAEDSKQKILTFTSSNNNRADTALEAGLDSVYIWNNPAGVFVHSGFEYKPVSRYNGSYSTLRNEIRANQAKGVRWGNHILPGFAYLKSPYGDAPAPSASPLDRFIGTRAGDLGTMTSTAIVGALTTSSNAITIAGRDRAFVKRYKTGGSNPNRGYARIGDEIVTYTGVEEVAANNHRLTGVTRDAYGTAAASHADGALIYALTGNFGYNSFYWGASAATGNGQAVGRSINDTGMDFLSLDGIESYWNNMYGELAANVFYKALFDTLVSKELSSEASRLSPYNWHFHDRWMWGEKNSQMLQGTYAYQFSNNVMFARNFLPHHTGGFFGSNNGVKDFGWLGSKIAALDAGTQIRDSGLSSSERAVLKKWNEAAEAGAFSDWQRARMLPWEGAYALDEVEAGRRWRLWQRGMTLTYGDDNEVTGVSYGAVGGAPTEKTNPFYVARPWAGFATRNVAGDALVTTSSKRDPGFQGANAVDGQIGYYKPYDSDYDQYGDGEVSEWHTAASDSARWIQLTWDSPQRIRAVLLADRSHPGNNVNGHTLRFSDGSTVTGTWLPDRGQYREHLIRDKETTTLKVTIDSHDGSNPGLGEIVVIADDPAFKGHLTGNASIVSGPAGGSGLFDGDRWTLATSVDGADSRDSKSIVIDLGDDNLWVDGLNVWRLRATFGVDSIESRGLVYQLSRNADFSGGVTTVFNNDSDGSAGQGTGSDLQYRETAAGKPVYFPPVRARYVRLWSNGIRTAVGTFAANQYAEVEVYGMKNLAQGITPTTDGDADSASGIGRATDGDIGVANRWELGGGLKYAQLDLGGSQQVDSLRVWRNFADKRRYHDVVLQLSDDATFASGVTTVFNNDLDNSAGRGAGTDGEYDETPTGKIVHFEPVRARYVRLYSNGNTRHDSNNYVEIMVGQAWPVPDITAPALAWAAADGATLMLSYDEALDASSTPDPSAFAVTVNGSTVTVRSVSISGSTVSLTLADAVPDGAAVRVVYTAPAGNPLRDEAGNAAPGFADRAVRISTPHSFDAGDLTITVSGQGRITALTGADGADYLAPGYTPALLKLIVADSPEAGAGTARQLLPVAVSRRFSSNRSLTFFYDYGIWANVASSRQPGYAMLQLVSLTNPANKDIRAAMWGPYEVTIDEQVADVAGVAYSRDFAIGIQAVNEKTFGGAPYEFTDNNYVSAFDHSGDAYQRTEHRSRNGQNVYWLSAARLTSFGSVLQAYSRDYSHDRMAKTAGFISLENDPSEWVVSRYVRKLELGHPLYALRGLVGSKIALFGVQRRGLERFGLNRRQVFKKEILDVIHAIELREDLPYTTGNGGLWSKLAEDSKQKTLGFSTSSNSRAATVLDAGLNSVYIWNQPAGVFVHNGFEYKPLSQYGGSYTNLRNEIRANQAQGVRWGNHILPGFARHGSSTLGATPVDRYIGSRPEDLAEYTRTTIVGDLTRSSGTITVAGVAGFRYGDDREYAQLGDELVAYTGYEDVGGINTRLTGVTRGIYGTSASSHADGTVIRKIADKWVVHPSYIAFAWGSNGTAEMGRALAESINDSGMDFTSLDGIESFTHDPHGLLSMNVFYKTLSDTLNSRELSGEASRITHYNWHFHDRWMWGEENTQMLQGTYSYQFSNIVMFARNFFPNHTGGFFGSNNGTKDFGWLGSKIAALDAGTLIRDSGFSDSEKAELKKWNEAAEAGAFSDWQRARMLPWEGAYALDEVEAGRRWRLWQQGMTLTYGADNKVTGVSYGAVGGAPAEKTNPHYVARPWAGFATRNVAGDALVTTSSKRDPSFQGDNAVDGHIGYYKPKHYKGTAEVSEWHTATSDSARWIKLTWDSPQRIRAVLLADRSHPGNNVNGHTLQFSDGSTHSKSWLYDRGRYNEHLFPSKETTSLKVTIDSHDGSNPGLGEIVVIAEDPDFRGHLTGNASIVSGYGGADGGKLFDGDLDSDERIDLGTGWEDIYIDLGDHYWVDGLRVWRDHANGPTYHDLEYNLAPGINGSGALVADGDHPVVTVFETGTSGSPEYKETMAGRAVHFPPVYARYLKLISNGSSTGEQNRLVEVEVYGMKNLAQGITPATDGNDNSTSNIDKATDGNLEVANRWELGGGLKYAQLDLGGSQQVDSLRVWRNFADKRRYHDVVLQLSDDATFASGVTTVFNNDLDNSARRGTGTDGEYDETATGKIVHFAPVRARYVRLYSDGNTRHDSNNYVEIMVGQVGQAASDIAAPALAWAAADGATLTLGYDEALDASSTPGASAFAVTVNGSTVTVRSVSIGGSTVSLTLADAVPDGAAVTVDYTAPAGNPLRDEAGNAAPGFADRAVRISTPHSFDAGDLTITVSGQGRITALTGADGADYLAPGYTPALLKLIVADSPAAAAGTARQLLPVAVSQRFSNTTSLTFFYDYGIRASVARSRQSGYATLELVSLTNPANKDIRAAMWGPYEVTIGEQVADVAGVAYSRDFAIGIQAANEKTLAGAPYEFTDDQKVSAFDHSAAASEGTYHRSRNGQNTYWRSAARLTTFGSVLQAYSRDYTADRVMKHAHIDGLTGNRFIGAITDSNHPLYALRELSGSKIALFGVRRRGAEAFGLNRRQVFKREIMRVIHAVERGEGLPWTTGNGGLWAKFAEDSKERVLVFTPDTDNFDSKARHAVVRAGADSHYYWKDPGGVFEHAGLNYSPKWSDLREDISDLHDAGLNMINHVLPGFAGYEESLQAQPDWDDAPLERAITSRPRDLAETTRTTIVDRLAYNADSVEIVGRDGRWRDLELSDRYDNTTARNFVEIGGELIPYTGVSDSGSNNLRLDLYQRGAFDTPRISHNAGTVIRLLAENYIYNALYWSSSVAKELGQALATSVNDYNLDGVSFDGIESFRGMHGPLGINVFYKEFMDNLNSRRFSSEGSRISHYNWHVHNRWMWGEVKGQMLKATFDYQFSNVVMFARNFFPNNTGGFYAADNGEDDFHWLGSKMAALDAGTHIRVRLYDKGEQHITRKWIEAIKAGAFSDWQRARMLPWETAYALDELKRGRQWRLWDMDLELEYEDPDDASLTSNVDFGDLTNPHYLARPWAGFATRNVAGDALVTTSSKRDPSSRATMPWTALSAITSLDITKEPRRPANGTPPRTTARAGSS